jgi:3'(2'), 5'-bisphosphate nucleotidase
VSLTAQLGEELRVAQRLALEAGALILEVYASDFSVVEKSGDQGPVTVADTRANEAIVGGLRAAFPSDSLIAEESPRRDETSSGRRWFVDPLDGTKEFVERNGMFAVQIGLSIDGEAVLGVVYAPVSRKLYSGILGGEATLCVDGVTRVLRVPPTRDLQALHLVVSRAHPSERTTAIMKRLGISKVSEQGSVGLKTGLIAEGAADLYLHPNPKSSRWDTCAPEAILRAAGGVLTDFTGTPYRYDAKELENVRGIIACAPEVLDAVLPIILELELQRTVP